MTAGVTAVVLGDDDSETVAVVTEALDRVAVHAVHAVDTVEEAVSSSVEVDCIVTTSVDEARTLLDRADGEVAVPVVALTPAGEAPLDGHERVRHHRVDDLGTLASRVVDAVLADRERVRASIAADADRSDEPLDECEAAYRTLVANIPDSGVTLFDRDLRYTWVGGAVFERVDLDPDDVAGRTLEEVHSEAFLEAHGDAYRGAFDGNRTEFEFTYDGRQFRTTVIPVVEGDEVAAGMTMTRDVTEGVERQRDLFVRTRAMDAAAIGLCLTDPTRPGNPLVYVNEGYERITGYDAEEVIGKNPSHLQGPETEPGAVREMREAVEEAEPVAVDVTNYRKDGTPFVNHVEITPIFDDDGELVHFLGSQVDVTDQYEREGELARRNEQLEEFASLVSHDLRSPLSVVRGRVELARETGDLSHLDHATASLDRASELIDDVLALAREGRTLDAERVERLSVGDVARAAWGTVDTADATLTVVDEWTVEADESRLRQLFENLFRNAVEHGSTDSRPPPDDAVDDSASGGIDRDAEDRGEEGDGSGSAVTVRVGPLDDGHGFFVEDDGPGIPADRRDDVFDAGVTTAEAGTGFGLAIVRSVADAHGWDVRVTAGSDGGARFEFTARSLDNGTD